MVFCPKCKAEVSEPTKKWSMLGDPDKKGSMAEITIGVYECHKCFERFPYAMGMKRLRIVRVDELERLQQALMKSRESISRLDEKVSALEEERMRLQGRVRGLEEKVVLDGLQSKVESLQREIANLREWRAELEEEVAAQVSMS